MKNNLNSVELLFLSRSLEQFQEDLRSLDKIIKDKLFSKEEILEMMSKLVAIKESIENLEINFLSRG